MLLTPLILTLNQKKGAILWSETKLLQLTSTATTSGSYFCTQVLFEISVSVFFYTTFT